ncbi:MAG: ABC transporter permease [Rhodothermaceae bacterium]
MLALKLAFRNIINAGLRTWLNVFVLSFAFVLIVWTQGLNDGMFSQIIDSKQDTEIGSGQIWHKDYDPYDPFTIEDAHAEIPDKISLLIKNNLATPMLLSPGAVFPNGRMFSALIKGIDPEQKILNFPSQVLKIKENDFIPALIGKRMSEATGLKKDDYVTIRWRDINGTFDAADVKIVDVFSTSVPTVDAGQIWLPLQKFQEMMEAENQATLFTLSKEIKSPLPVSDNWVLRDFDFLMKDLMAAKDQKIVSTYLLFAVLLGMALIAIFDTQVLAIFRRRKEMGTMIALGMTRTDVIKLFTIEGSLHGILALLAGAVYGIPLLAFTAANGISLPEMSQNIGLAIGAKIYPAYGLPLLASTSFILFITVVIVSFLPTRKIAHLKPTDAIRGKM